MVFAKTGQPPSNRCYGLRLLWRLWHTITEGIKCLIERFIRTLGQGQNEWLPEATAPVQA
jgi:hypothetical protein